MSEVLLDVNGLCVDFPTEDGTVHAVRNVSYKLSRGEVLGIVGESGSGKSVSSMATMGLLPRTAKVSGSVKFRGDELVGLSQEHLQAYRGAKIAMIFQDPMTAMNPVYTVGWQIAEAIRAHQNISKKAAKAKAVDMLHLVGIPEPKSRVDSFPHEFSGGMRQRAMIAMAISNDPEVIIADEPTTALDVTVQAQILETLVRIKEELGSAILLITHDLGVVAGMVDRMMVMYAGTVVEAGTAEEVFYKPRMPYTVGLLGSIPKLTGDQTRLVPIQGAPPSLINLPKGCPFSSRCPIVQASCEQAEPPLAPIGTSTHLTACWRTDVLEAMPDVKTLFMSGITA